MVMKKDIKTPFEEGMKYLFHDLGINFTIDDNIPDNTIIIGTKDEKTGKMIPKKVYYFNNG